MVNSERCSKKMRASQPAAVVAAKKEPEGRPRGPRSHGGDGDGAPPPLPALTEEEEEVDGRIAVSVYHCQACRLPLKPPIFKCKAGHIVCCLCEGKGGHCGACNRATTFTRTGDLDSFVAAFRVPCPYAEHGCKGIVVYHGVADHKSVCAYAPCSCPEPGCGFSGSTERLADHFAAAHSWPLVEVRYGKPYKLTVPTTRHRHVLVGEQDRSLFVASLGERGAAVEVSLVCVRPNGAAAADGAIFSCSLWVEDPKDKDNMSMAAAAWKVQSGGFAAEEQGMFFNVPRELVQHKASGGRVFPLTVLIDKRFRRAGAANPSS